MLTIFGEIFFSVINYFISTNGAHHLIFDYKRALSPNGVYVVVGGSSARVFQTIVMGPLISMMGSKKMSLLLHKPNKGLNSMIKLFETGKVNSVIDKRYPLGEVPEAFRYFGGGQARGKVVITMEHNS